jgi:hypothetical protein
MSASRVLVLILGVLGGLGGMVHGLAEVRKGNTGTEGHVLASVGAVTLIPNYLATGIVALALGAAAVIWTVGFAHRKHGPVVFLALFVALFLAGGGVAQVPFFVLGWGVATRIGKPVSWFDRPPLAQWRPGLAAAWSPLLVAAVACLAGGMLVWMVLLPPGVGRPISVVHYVCWSLLGGGLALLPCAVFTGLARDAASLAVGRRHPPEADRR